MLLYVGIYVFFSVIGSSMSRDEEGGFAADYGKAGEIPSYVVYMTNEKGKFTECVGVIYSKDLVITVADCAKSKENIRVRSGSRQLGKGAQHKVVFLKRHEKYEEQAPVPRQNNIALLRINPPLKFDMNTTVARLTNKVPKDGSKGRVTGWGYQYYSVNLRKNQEKVSEVTVISHETCVERNKKRKTEPGKTTICATNRVDSNEACARDAGSPLEVNGKVAGLAIKNNDCVYINHPNVFTNIYKFKKWIKNTAKSLPKCNSSESSSSEQCDK